MPAWLFLAMLAFVVRASAQQPFASNLPIVLIVTDNDPSATHFPINDSVKIGATMTIIYADGTNSYSLADTNNPSLLNYNGRIGIKTRGHTSLKSNKKSYSVETRKADDVSNNNVPLMGMPSENDWVLSALYGDNSHIRDALTFALGRRTGRYAPRTHHCELFINGDYRGLYMLTEKIKVDKNRVNIKKMTAADTCGEALTGGYIFKADHPDDNEPVAWTTFSRPGDIDVIYIHHYPKPEDITQQQHNYLYNYFNSFQDAVNRNDTSSASGYLSLIDLQSFVDYMIICELASNSDSYQYSTFFYKNRNGKMCAGPLWDFNQAYGNDPRGRDGYDVWQFDNGSNTGSPFWVKMFRQRFFRKKLETRWKQLTSSGPLSLDSTMALIDSLSCTITEAALRDRNRWEYNSNHSQCIDSLKTWLELRYAWLDMQLHNNNSIVSPQLSDNDYPLSIYPNPTTNQIRIVLPEENELTNCTKIDIINSIGATIMSLTPTENDFTADISHAPSGIYLIRLSTANGQQFNKRLVVAP